MFIALFYYVRTFFFKLTGKFRVGHFYGAKDARTDDNNIYYLFDVGSCFRHIHYIITSDFGHPADTVQVHMSAKNMWTSRLKLNQDKVLTHIRPHTYRYENIGWKIKTMIRDGLYLRQHIGGRPMILFYRAGALDVNLAPCLVGLYNIIRV